MTLAVALWGPSLIGPGVPSAAAFTCPSGWTSVSDVNVPTITQMCTKSFTGFNNAYFIKAPSQHVGQWTEQDGFPCTTSYAGNSGNWNPQLKKRYVLDWLLTKRGCGWDIGLAINGTFFNDNNNSHPTSSVSFPFKYGSGGYVTGSDLGWTRYCIAFGGANSTPGRSLWDETTGTWTNVGIEFNTAAPDGCKRNTTYHQVVGVAPSTVIEYPFPYFGNIPRTYIGKATSGNNVCILVGGNFTNSAAVSTMTTFSCNGSVQLDGGKSSQMSYYNTSGTISSPVTGCCGENLRLVPHVIVIWR